MKKKLNLTVTNKYYANGSRKEEVWELPNGDLHNPNGPALRKWHQNGNISRICYYKNDSLHSENGPAVINYDDTGKEVSSIYYLNGESYSLASFKGQLKVLQDKREANKNKQVDLSHEVCYVEVITENDKIVEEKWIGQSGLFNNPHGVAHVCVFYEHGTEFKLERHYRNGKLHNESGPAEILINIVANKICEEFYYLDGIRYMKNQFEEKNALKKNSCNNKIVEIDGVKYKLVEVESQNV